MVTHITKIQPEIFGPPQKNLAV